MPRSAAPEFGIAEVIDPPIIRDQMEPKDHRLPY